MRNLILLGAMILTGCTKPAAPALPPAPPATAGALRFLALGDSYTIGESVDASQRWPVQLAAALRRSGINIADPEIIARTGWTTGNLADAINDQNPRGPYDLVGLLIGVNNQYQGRSEAEYRAQFADLLSRSITLAGEKPTHVIVLSIPDWGVTPYAKEMNADPATVGAAIDRFNAIARELTEKSGATFVDITPISRQNRDLIADDGLHPNGEMYAKWIELAVPAVKKAIGSRGLRRSSSESELTK
jgi:lysophospholipase L1-like esterase